MIDFKATNQTKLQKQQHQWTFLTGDTLTCQMQVFLIALITAVFNLEGPVPALVLCLLLAAIVNEISSTCVSPAATMPAKKKAYQDVLRIVAWEKHVFTIVV